MNGFKIGFIVLLSFLLVTTVYSGTAGYFPPPEGPKAPEYPTNMDYSPYSQPLNVLQAQPQQFTYPDPVESDYDRAMKEYQEDYEKYEKEQETFVDREIIPYVRNIVVAWIVLHTIFVLVGIAFIKMRSELVGSGFAFSSVWTIFFMPLACTIWYINIMISAFSRQAEQTFSVDPVFQAVMWSSIASVVVLSIAGTFLFGSLRVPRLDFGQPKQPQNSTPQQ